MLQFANFFWKLPPICVVWFSTNAAYLYKSVTLKIIFFWSSLLHHDNLVVASVGSLWNCHLRNWSFRSWFQFNTADFPNLLICGPTPKVSNQIPLLKVLIWTVFFYTRYRTNRGSETNWEPHRLAEFLQSFWHRAFWGFHWAYNHSDWSQVLFCVKILWKNNLHTMNWFFLVLPITRARNRLPNRYWLACVVWQRS